ncbi:MAG: glycerate kinase, partial [Actinobacteria bacterium]|nr:glycerate kinase [Actinomycetota bacterium]
VNKFRGDPALLGGVTEELRRRCGVATLGVLPWIHDVALDAEDSLGLDGPRPRAWGTPTADRLDVAVIRLPHLANVTDFDALSLEPGVKVRLVERVSALGRPDLVVLPGTKATVADLEWLRGRGLHRAIEASGARVLGICGGYQMMGRTIVDHVESGRGAVEGLGWLDADTVFEADKITRPRRGRALGAEVTGYQIHHGRTASEDPWITLDDGWGRHPEGAADADAAVFGTSLHGLFESDEFRTTFLDAAPVFAPQKGATPAQVELLRRRLERLAQVYEQTYGVDVRMLVGSGAAGGLAGGLAAVGARLVPGFDVVAEELELQERLEGADLAVAGEGFLDEQSFAGKAVGGVVELAAAAGVPVLAVAGEVLDDVVVPDGVEAVSLVERFGRDRAVGATLTCVEEVVAERLARG